MTAATLLVPISDDSWVSIVGPNVAIALKYGQKVRIYVGATAPPIDTPNYLSVMNINQSEYTGHVFAFRMNDIAATDFVYVRDELGPNNIIVVNGDGKPN